MGVGQQGALEPFLKCLPPAAACRDAVLGTEAFGPCAPLLQDGAEYYLDGNFYGSVGRFLNHFCDPNLVSVRVTVGHEIPSIAFFTNRAVQAGKELG